MTQKSRVPAVLSAALAGALLLAPGPVDARAGGGGSFGSRGSRTYSAPPPTNAAPFSAAPIERSLTPREPMPGYAAPSYANPGYAAPRRSPFASGFMGGLIGAGLGGLLLGHGLFGGFDGLGSLFGVLIQIALVVLAVRFLLNLMRARQPAGPGFGAMFARNPIAPPQGSAMPPPPRQVAVTRADYERFERLLQDVQAAWSDQDQARMRAVATPEMVSMFGEQIAALRTRGVRNSVGDVRLDRGDLAEAWSEGVRDYATVAMRYTMVDVTRDARGYVVDGSPDERVSVAELWTFLRVNGGDWLLSAIQQAR